MKYSEGICTQSESEAFQKAPLIACIGRKIKSIVPVAMFRIDKSMLAK